MARSYSFQVIRVSPDKVRGETVNIGIVVFDESNVDVRILPSLRKLEALDATIDIAAMYNLKSFIPSLFSKLGSTAAAVEALEDLGLTSDVGSGGFVGRDEDYERIVDGLMRRLVEPKRKKLFRVRDTRISSDLRRTFRRQNILGTNISDIDNHLIVPRYPISDDLDLYADFALKNGTMNLVRTIDFRVKNAPSAEKFREACAISFSFIKARELFKNSTRMVVYAADSSIESSLSSHFSILADDAEQLLNYESAQDRAYLIDKFQEAASGQQRLN